VIAKSPMNSSQIICKKIFQIGGAQPNEKADSDIIVNFFIKKRKFFNEFLEALNI